MDNLALSGEDSFSFWKNLTLVIVFFLITPVALGTSLFSLVSLNQSQEVEKTSEVKGVASVEYREKSGAQVFASLPTSFPAVDGQVETEDARPEIIRQYLAFYNSPLEPYAEELVNSADKYGLDYRLLTAIAQQESNLCKKIPEGSNNCWGWGIHSKGTLKFESYPQAIDTVSKGLKEAYIDKGYQTPEEIMSKYTPLSNGSWAAAVTQFMSDLE